MVEQRASKKQQELLSFVDGFIKGNGYGPSYREIMRALGYKSVSTVAIHINGLIAKGYLARHDKSARSLEVVTTHIAHVVAKPPAEVSARLNLETEIIALIEKAELSDKDIVETAKVFERIGLTKVSDKLKGEQ